MSGFGSECRFPPLKLLPAIALVVARHAESRGVDRVNIVSHYTQWCIRLQPIYLAQRRVTEDLCKAAAPSCLYAFNVFLRDGFSCQYCGAPNDLTFDHVIPRRAGGRTTWENVVAACSPCNLKKGGRMPKKAGMVPRQNPHQPTVYELHENGRKFPPNYCHESWQDYLYWDTELEP